MVSVRALAGSVQLVNPPLSYQVEFGTYRLGLHTDLDRATLKY